MEKFRFHEELTHFMENSSIPFAIYQFVDKQICTLVVTRGLCKLFGYKDHQQAYRDMNDDLFRFIHPDDYARLANAVMEFANGGERIDLVYRTRMRNHREYRIIHITGEYDYPAGSDARIAHVWYTDEGVYTRNPKKANSYMNQQLNSALHEESLLRANHYDILTGLPSMTLFFQLAELKRLKMTRERREPAILYLDFSGMRFFNQKHGFEEGNALLRAFAEVLTRHFDKHDCCRFGEDHFAVIAENSGLDVTLNSIFAECRTMNGGRTLPLRAGIYPDTMGSVDVSTACDRAKFACDSERDPDVSVFTYFDRKMLEAAEKRQYILDNFDRALDEKWIKVYYQPIVRASSGKTSDEEALARWIDPVLGFLSPADFIPVLEESKLIYRLDLYMADRILEKIKMQSEAGLYVVPQSVNLSRVDFEQCDIVEEICRRVDASGVGRDKLTIEVTESVVGSDFDFMKSQIERFQALGFSVWMDDFGSGYSSLDVLQSLHFDVIKFDMRFMEQFESNERSRIILTELIRMAMGLGIETVCEGVETKEQADFLCEAGCTKLQGYYYNKPTPFEGILERYEKGIQIGFENPEESGYFTAIGKINLYDLMTIAAEDEASLRLHFDTIPSAIMEINGTSVVIVRCNSTFRSFMDEHFARIFKGINKPMTFKNDEERDAFLASIRQCVVDGSRLIVDQKLDGGGVAHMFLKRIAVNPVTGSIALAIAVLAVMDEESQNTVLTYGHIAEALSSDYFNLYYVDLETESFIEFRSDASLVMLDTERHGEDFFAASRRDALTALHKDDQEEFIRSFTKENIIRSLDEHGSFTLIYRQLLNGTPTYVCLKAVRIMERDDHHIIVGISSVDEQMRQKEALERVRGEQITYARIAAISGDYVCVYDVDPDTDSYTEYAIKQTYDTLELPVQGDNFYEESYKEGKRVLYPDDYAMLCTRFTKENILRDIERYGKYELQYRLMILGEPTYVALRAAMVEEKDGPHLIVGVMNVDSRVKQEREFAHTLLEARNRANLDNLTGVKNQMAFHEILGHISQEIHIGHPVHFSVVAIHMKSDMISDDMLLMTCSVICSIYKRSPVFRVEDDMFAVITRGQDYENRDERYEELKKALCSIDVPASCGTVVFTREENAMEVYQCAYRQSRQ